jgi:hypothetical protein
LKREKKNKRYHFLFGRQIRKKKGQIPKGGKRSLRKKRRKESPHLRRFFSSSAGSSFPQFPAAEKKRRKTL